jgi:hypothetical protein
MPHRRVLTLALAVMTLTASAATADVRVVIGDGRVVVVAEEATVAEILAEWARVGQTRFVNLDRIASGRVTLDLDVSEPEALEVLLKDAAGYVATQRTQLEAALSLFARVVIMPGANTVTATDPATAPAFEDPAHQVRARDLPASAPPVAAPAPTAVDAAPAARRPVFSAIPRRQTRRPPSAQPAQPAAPEPVETPPAVATPSHLPSAPADIASPVPGVVVQPPAAKPRPRPGD